jgi:hypothetical protein
MSTDDKAIKEPTVFFLTGLPKTGTTWLMNMLNDVDGIRCLGEGRFFSSELRNVPSLHGSVSNALRPWYEFIALRKNNWLHFDQDIQTVNRKNYISDQTLERRFQKDIARIMHLVVKDIMTSLPDADQTTQLIGDKTPILRPAEIAHIRRTFPEAKCVFLQRNVKDFIVSLLCHYYRSMKDNRPDRRLEFFTIEDFLQLHAFMTHEGEDKPAFVSNETALRLAAMWKDVDLCVSQLAQQQPAKNLLISYEQMQQTPMPEVQKVFSFLGFEVDQNLLKTIVARHNREAVMKSDNTALKGHIRSGETGDWMRYLSRETSDIIDQFLA